MLKVSQLLIAGLTVIAGPALAECFYPEDVKIPDGAASTYEEMRDSQAFVKEYMAEMETYLECLEQEDQARRNQIQENQAQANDQTNATLSAGTGDSPYIQRRHKAIDAMESVAARFNEQVRAYKKVNP